jgi:hypothetical protein
MKKGDLEFLMGFELMWASEKNTNDLMDNWDWDQSIDVDTLIDEKTEEV